MSDFNGRRPKTMSAITRKSGTNHAQTRICVLLKRGLMSGMLLTLPACSSIFMPYENDFAIKTDDFGRKIHPQSAHDESVAMSGGDAQFSTLPAENAAQAGVPSGAPTIESVHRVSAKNDPIRFAVGQPMPESHTPYTSYQTAVYKQITGMLEAPTPPVMQAATQVRTLILPYADRNRPDRLYMPRFVYSVVSGPRWVLGQYKTRAAAQQLPAAFEQGATLPVRVSPGGDGVLPTPASVNSTEPKQAVQPQERGETQQMGTDAAKDSSDALDLALKDGGLAALLESANTRGQNQ